MKWEISTNSVLHNMQQPISSEFRYHHPRLHNAYRISPVWYKYRRTGWIMGWWGTTQRSRCENIISYTSEYEITSPPSKEDISLFGIILWTHIRSSSTDKIILPNPLQYVCHILRVEASSAKLIVIELEFLPSLVSVNRKINEVKHTF